MSNGVKFRVVAAECLEARNATVRGRVVAKKS